MDAELGMAKVMRFPVVAVMTGLLVLPSAGSCADTAAPKTPPAIERLTLGNEVIEVTATPSFGGRILAFQLRGQPSVLKLGAAVEQQRAPQVSAIAGDIAYLGHDVWVGPQSHWWLHQQVNPQRKAAGAVWPPDPYLSLATTRATIHDATQLVMDGAPSPVTGVQLRKRVALSPSRPDTIDVQASARNIRTEPLSWDLWFNTRVAADTRVFVPVADAADLRLQPPSDPGTVAPRYQLEGGLFVLSADRRADTLVQRGKLLLQPSAGWMAGFAGTQVLVIRFAHQPKARIHPEQGQVELYLDVPPQHPEHGLLEMEVHAPYRTLAPGADMQAQEQWTLLRYTGPDEPQAQRHFLCSKAQELALTNACAGSAAVP
ncbi:DUF4380 domain-containing protein [Xanthomonas campestris pv. raphani]|uniref:DUF4380 domain-containing protein n=1 Tax=Xanthomonas campestris TaxID=339 RepID=UPI002B22E293|nr:DUF4380 domain-containing protein [Xanthomonas campestris]MEA9748256.1 DUF4380 domain-containing protein [Xanthomonas campestris pv. raphani]MEA9848540.1 DUF4380 domain-containing protein [Xanthomonas campestris pv. raphani]MEA9931271.1 DUF4380 domain-containing protein [Xanthomonas campestris pv. raphani]